MVDKNGNGIPDSNERGGTLPAGSSRKNARVLGAVPVGSKNGVASASRPPMPGSLGPGNKTNVANAGRGIFTGGPGGVERSGRPGGRTFGVDKEVRPIQRPQQSMEETALPSFLANLMDALQNVSGSSGVDFDPLRNDARGRGAEYDARINAMYNQLQNSMRQDGEGIQQNYQGAIDQNSQRTDQAQQSIQGASDAAAQRNLQQLQALGIGEAAGNIVAEGRDLNTDTARAVQQAEARGQISGENLAQNQQSAGALNNSLVGAAGLEGNLQRSRVQSELNNLLAQYDVQEQEANQNAQQQSMSQAMSLAGALTDDQWKQRGYQDDVSRYMAEQQQSSANQPNKLSQSLSFLQSLMQSPQFQDSNIEDLLPYIQALGGIGKLV